MMYMPHQHCIATELSAVLQVIQVSPKISRIRNLLGIGPLVGDFFRPDRMPLFQLTVSKHRRKLSPVIYEKAQYASSSS